MSAMLPSSRPTKRKQGDGDNAAVTMASPPSSTRDRRFRTAASPSKKLKLSGQQHQNRCRARLQQAMEQINSDMGDVMKAYLAEWDSFEQEALKNKGGPPVEFLMLHMFEYKRVVQLVESMYNPHYGNIMTFGSDDSLQLGIRDVTQQETNSGVDTTTSPRFLKHLKANMVGVSIRADVNLGLDRDGNVYSWGSNDEGALGRETVLDVAEQTPTMLKGFKPSKHGPVLDIFPDTEEDGSMIQVSAGVAHSLFLSIRGSVYTAGCYRDDDGTYFRVRRPPDDDTQDKPLGDQGKVESDVRGRHFQPTHVYQLKQNIKMIVAGNSMSAALADDGSTLYSWGAGSHGEMARSSSMTTNKDEDGYPDLAPMVPSKKPFQPEEPKGKKATPEAMEEYRRDLAAYPGLMKQYHERLKVFERDFLTPHPVDWAGPPMKQRSVLHIACGGWHFLAVARDMLSSLETDLYASGMNNYGQLGMGDTRRRDAMTLVEAMRGKNIAQVAGGLQHSLCLDISGKHVYAFGRADYGQIGNTPDQPAVGAQEETPVLVPFPKPTPEEGEGRTFCQVACGDNHCLALTNRGTAYSWGFNDTSGALGHGHSSRDEFQARRIKVMRKYPNDQGIVRMVAGGAQHSALICSKF